MRLVSSRVVRDLVLVARDRKWWRSAHAP